MKLSLCLEAELMYFLITLQGLGKMAVINKVGRGRAC